MNSLDAIAVRVEPATGNVEPLLHEIRHALLRLAEPMIPAEAVAQTHLPASETASTVIDLRSLPLAPGEEERIETVLGVGEVRAELTALGSTVVQETQISGVWLVTHRNTSNEVMAKFIEVTRMPAILLAQNEDIQHGIEHLNRELGIES